MDWQDGKTSEIKGLKLEINVLKEARVSPGLFVECGSLILVTDRSIGQMM